MTQRDTEKHANGGSIDERQARLARARQAFDRGIRDASENGARAARRLLVPALWGAALMGGALLAFAMVRMLRRPSTDRALLRITIEPKLGPRPLLPALGGAVARFAVQRLLASPAPESTPELQHAATDTLAGASAASRHTGASNGRSPA